MCAWLVLIMTWNPDQYLHFSDHRLRPAIDLLNAIPPISAKHVVDLGCGTGSVLPALRNRWPNAELSAVDQSVEMLTAAKETFSDAIFSQADIADWRPEGKVDVIFSNAALNWLDHHDSLLRRLAGFLSEHGVLAVQMPRNHDRPSHTCVAEIVDTEPYASKLKPLIKPAPVHAPSYYMDCLSELRNEGARIDVWETDYQQIMQGDNPVVEWTKGTYLRPFLDALDGEDRANFEAHYREKIKSAYPRLADGSTIFAFRRLFIVVALGI